MKREINISKALDVRGTLEKAKKAAHRAAKKGLSGGYEVYVEERRNGDVIETVLVIEGEPARYDGWTFVAMVEVENGGLMVSSSPFYTGPAWDRETFVKDACEHCNRSIARRRYVIVERDGVRKQVGASCVKDFLGEPFKASWFSDDLDQIEASFGGGFSGFYMISVLEWAARVISARGFVKSSEPGSTRDLVAEVMGQGQHAEKLRREIGLPGTAETQEAFAAYEWAANMPGHSDYALNVRTLFSQERETATASDKRLGLVVSVLASYRRSIAEEQVKAERPSVPAPVGRVDVEGVVVSVKWQENDFGGSLKMLVEAEPGYRVWGTVPKDLTMIPVVKDNGRWEEWREVNVGDRVAFTATLTPSENDPAFAFAKRPSKARLVAA